MNLGRAIKLCRIHKNMKQSDLAVNASISVSYLSLIEQGKRDPNTKTIKKITRALDVPMNILIFLASDEEDLGNMDRDLVERLSYVSLKLMEPSANES